MGAKWSTICDDGFGNNEARVICRALGKPWTGAVAVARAVYGMGSGSILMSELACTGSEAEVLQCPYVKMPICSHAEDAGVVCRDAGAMYLPPWATNTDDQGGNWDKPWGVGRRLMS